MELWDAYDKNLNKLDLPPLIRGNEIPDGVYHLVCDILVQHIDGDYLLMQRDYRKHLGGMWEATAGGSALQGEQELACANRELNEETGIIADELKQLGIVIQNSHHSIYCEFLYITSMKKDAVRLQDGETINYKWVDKEQLLSMTNEELATTRVLKYVSR